MSDVHRTTKRSLVKAFTYRAIIVVLDVSVIYLLTGRMDIALGFTVISNIYTTVAYFLHERLWNKIKWGTENIKPL
jgi:adenylylsulfate kinase